MAVVFHVSPAQRNGALIFCTVAVISALHYATSGHSVVLHETLKRLYYVPIVAAAVSYGVLGGALTALASSLLYLPHVTIAWLPWPLVESHQVGELVLFHLVGLVTGTMADRLRRRRDQLRRTASALVEANTRLRRSSDERLRLDRLVLLGRVSTGIADSVRNPLAAVLGCLEILEGDVAPDHRHREFYRVARTELGRADAAIRSLLEFAHPGTPVTECWKVRTLVDGVTMLASGTLGPRLRIEPPEGDVARAELSADLEQTRRALLTLVLCDARAREVRLTCRLQREVLELYVDITQERAWSCDSSLLLEPFGTIERSDLSLPTARHLLEMQGGRVEVSHAGDLLSFRVRLPLVPASIGIPEEV